MVVGAFFLQGYEGPKNRYHQHLEAKTKEVCTDHGDDVFCTHLPLLNITTDGEIPGPYVIDDKGNKILTEDGEDIRSRNTVNSSIKFINSKNANNHLNDMPEIDANAQFRIRGNSSRRFDKKSYLIQFVDENNMKLDVSLDGMPADDSWALHGPFLDKTLIRNYMCNNIVAEIDGYAPNVRFCEFVLNGEYKGVYLLLEKINYNKNGRVKITKTDPKETSTSYILKFESGETEDLYKLETFADQTGKRGISQRSNEKLEILYPSTTLTQEQKTMIQYEISDFEKILMSKNTEKNFKNIEKYIDVQSFVDFYILSEFFMNNDAGKQSTFVIKDVRGKIKIAGWDYNNVFNNFFVDLRYPQDFCLNNSWYSYLLKNPEFVDRVVSSYKKLRKSYLSDEYLYQYIDETIEYLGPAIDRNNEVWGYSFSEDFINDEKNSVQTLAPKRRNPRSYKEAVDDMKEMISERGKFLDENIDYLYLNCE